MASSEDGTTSAHIDDDGLPLPGTVLGAYVIEQRLGQGGMAAVFAARHRALGKRVAIKLLFAHNAAREEIARRFIREGEAAARLDHPHVVGVTDVGTDARGSPFLVMEYLEGEDLASRLKREGKLTVEQIADILLPVVSAVAAAHDAGIVHRDLKPQNIFLARERSELVPKVLDFGIAKLIEVRGPLTREAIADADAMMLTGTGTILGTPYYISPEQAQGTRKVDARSDQFSLGVIMYECVTGVRPFRGESLYSVIAGIVSAQPAPPRKLVRPLDPRFEALVNRALAKDPAARFVDMRALGAALLPLASFRTRLEHGAEFGDTTGSAAREPSADALRELIVRVRAALRLPRWARGLLLVVAPLVLSLAIVLVTHRRRAALPPPAPTRTSVLQRPASAVVPQDPERPPPPSDGPLVASPPGNDTHPELGATPPSEFAIRLATRPASATITLDGVHAGIGSLARTLPADGRQHLLEVSLPGYRSATLAFRDAPPAVSTVVLMRSTGGVPTRGTGALTAKRTAPSALTPPPRQAEPTTGTPTAGTQPAASPPAASAPAASPPRQEYGTNHAPIVR